MAGPLVSVVIPVYNGARYVWAAIESVLAQRSGRAAIECIVVNDGSTDDSAAVIASFGDRVVAIRQANAGVAAARNAGLRAARGEFVAFLDQDDWWLPEKIERQMERALADRRVDLVHTEVCYYDEVGGRTVGRLNALRPDLLVGPCYEQLLLGNAITNSTVMVRRAALDAVGFFDTGLAGNTVQDYDLWLRIAQRGALDFVPEKLAVYRLHPGQGMWRVSESLAQELQVLERHGARELRRCPVRLRARVAGLLEELGVALLDEGQLEAAGAAFRRALAARWSGRRALLWLATRLPDSAVRGLRDGRVRLQRWRGQPGPGNVPTWVRPGK
jgi:CTP:molybdopterin cytidylyltransferase MocA